MPVPTVTSSFGRVLGEAAATIPGEVNPLRVFARTVHAGAPERWWVLTIDASLGNPPGLRLVNRIDVTGDGAADVKVRVTPQVVTLPNNDAKDVVTVEVMPVTQGTVVNDLVLDVGVRLDAPIAPPDDAPDAEYIVITFDTRDLPLLRRQTLLLEVDEDGTEGTVGFARETHVNLGTDAGGLGPGAAGKPLALEVETRTGATRRVTARVVPPTLEDGTPAGVPTVLNREINVPNEAVAPAEGVHALVELTRPADPPHMPAPGLDVIWTSRQRRAGADPVFQDVLVAKPSVPVELVADTVDLVTAARTFVATSAIQSRFDLDNDPLRESRDVPHLRYTAAGRLDSLDVRAERPGSDGRLRHVVVAAAGLPRSLGLRLELVGGEPLRAVLSAADDVRKPIPPPQTLGGMAFLAARELGQLPPLDSQGRPTPLALGEQTFVFDLDDVPVGDPAARPLAFGSGRALPYFRVAAATPAPKPRHADADDGLVIDLRLAEDVRSPAPHEAPRALDRALRLQLFRRDPVGGTLTRLLARAGGLPDVTLADLKALPPNPDVEGDPGYFGLRLYGECRWVSATFMDSAAHVQSVDGRPRRLRVSVPRTPTDYLDILRDATGLAVDATEPVEAHVALTDREGIGGDPTFTRLTALATLGAKLALPPVDDGVQVEASPSATGRVALVGPGIPFVAVRATPQVAIRQAPASAAGPARAQATTARIYGLTGVRQGQTEEIVAAEGETLTHVHLGLDPARANRAGRLLVREEHQPDPATGPVVRDALKLRVADLPPSMRFVNREGVPTWLDGRLVKNPSQLRLELSARSGPGVIWSESVQRPHDGPRAGSDVGIGVRWLAIDSVPPLLVVTSLSDERYAPGRTSPRNWPEVPDSFTRDGFQFQASEPLAIRELLQVAWDRDREPAASTSAWTLLYIRRIELGLDPVPVGTEPPAFRIWPLAHRPASGGDFAEPDAVLGVEVDDGLKVTFDLDQFETHTTAARPRWDELPGNQWLLRSEVQLDRYEGEFSVGKTFLAEQAPDDPVRGGEGPGLWYVRAAHGWPIVVGGGSAAFGNAGGAPFHRDRIWP